VRYGLSRDQLSRKVKAKLSDCRGSATAIIRITTGISGNLEMSENSPEVREKSGNLCSQGILIVAAQLNNLSVFHSYCNSFFICDVDG